MLRQNCNISSEIIQDFPEYARKNSDKIKKVTARIRQMYNEVPTDGEIFGGIKMVDRHGGASVSEARICRKSSVDH